MALSAHTVKLLLFFAWLYPIWEKPADNEHLKHVLHENEPCAQRGKVFEVVLNFTPAAHLRAPLAHITANL
jgi:hypothetical protein